MDVEVTKNEEENPNEPTADLEAMFDLTTKKSKKKKKVYNLNVSIPILLIYNSFILLEIIIR